MNQGKKEKKKRSLTQSFGWLVVLIGFLFAASLSFSNIEAGGSFIDFSKWQTLIFWARIIANTIFVVLLYNNVLHTERSKLKDTSYYLQQESILMKHKNDIIDQNKKQDFSNYLDVVINADEKLEKYYIKLNKKVMRYNNWFNRTFRHTNAVIEIAKINDEKLKVDKYRTALRQLDLKAIKDNDFNLNEIAVNHQDVSFDVVFDLVDGESSKSISLAYSDVKEANKLVRKEPLRSLAAVFSSIVVVSNVFVLIEDWLSGLISILALGFMALSRMIRASQDSQYIISLKMRSMEKANLTSEVFLKLNDNQLKDIKSIIYKDYDNKYNQEQVQDERINANVVKVEVSREPINGVEHEKEQELATFNKETTKTATDTLKHENKPILKVSDIV